MAAAGNKKTTKAGNLRESQAEITEILGIRIRFKRIPHDGQTDPKTDLKIRKG